MPHEAIGEILVGVAELGLEAAAGGVNDKKSGMGCLLMTIVLILLIGGIYYVATKEPTPPTHGLVTKKLPNNKMVIKTKKGEAIYTINQDLYLNKQEGDSIILK